MNVTEQGLSRRGLLKILAGASSGIAVSRWLGAGVIMAQELLFYSGHLQSSHCKDDILAKTPYLASRL